MNLEAVLEGLLYVVGEDGLTLDQVKTILDLDDEEAIKLIDSLKNSYEQENRGLRINFLGNTFKLTTKSEHKEYYEQLIEDPNTNFLSQAALETLAIMAYNEPITRTMVDEIRGVNSSHIVRKLCAKGFIKEIGKSNLPGRPILYQTTNEFLSYFGLSSVSDLPVINQDEVTTEESELFNSNYHDSNDQN